MCGGTASAGAARARERERGACERSARALTDSCASAGGWLAGGSLRGACRRAAVQQGYCNACKARQASVDYSPSSSVNGTIALPAPPVCMHTCKRAAVAAAAAAVASFGEQPQARGMHACFACKRAHACRHVHTRARRPRRQRSLRACPAALGCNASTQPLTRTRARAQHARAHHPQAEVAVQPAARVAGEWLGRKRDGEAVAARDGAQRLLCEQQLVARLERRVCGLQRAAARRVLLSATPRRGEQRLCDAARAAAITPRDTSMQQAWRRHPSSSAPLTWLQSNLKLRRRRLCMVLQHADAHLGQRRHHVVQHWRWLRGVMCRSSAARRRGQRGQRSTGSVVQQQGPGGMHQQETGTAAGAFSWG